jgi:uncharacterized protein YbaP (TraB family)
MKSLLAVFALMLACLPAPSARAEPPNTLLWEVASPHRTLYLTGDTQALADSDYPLPATMMQAFAASGELMTEGNPGTSVERGHALIVKYGLLAPPTHLQDLLDATQLHAFKQALSALSVPYAQVGSFQPWLAALFMQQTLASKLGFDPAKQEISYFYGLAKSRGIPVTPLKTTEEELRLFAGMPTALQAEWLTMGAGQISGDDWKRDASARFAEIATAWRSGDTDVLSRLLMQQFRGHDALYRTLVTERNQDWLQSLRAKLANEGPPVFVVVGAGHLVGDGNLISGLHAAGYRVTQR